MAWRRAPKGSSPLTWISQPLADADRDQVAALAGRELGARHQQPGGRQVGHADHGRHRLGALVGDAREVVVRQQVVVGAPK